jgi:hypothetical protein
MFEETSAASSPAGRTALLLAIAEVFGAAWLLEQPSSSVLKWHPRFRWVIKNFPQAHVDVSTCPFSLM